MQGLLYGGNCTSKECIRVGLTYTGCHNCPAYLPTDKTEKEELKMPYTETVKVRYFVEGSRKGSSFERRAGFAKLEKAREFRDFMAERENYTRIILRTITEREEIIE